MYLYHFGFREFPFGLTPDTDYFCALPAHVDAMNTLLVALATGEGFVKVVGEVGTGKTLLCRRLLDKLEASHHCAFIPNPYLSAEALRFQLASELGLRVARDTEQGRLTNMIERRLIKLRGEGKPVVLIVDEAQALPDETLEALRLFTNLETEKRKLMQVVLFGQPELDARLAQPHLRQLRQRITFSCHLRPLSRAELKAYVHHRLSAARANPAHPVPVTLSWAAWRVLHAYSRGIPRLINILMHKALIILFGERRYQIKRRHIRLAALDTDDIHLSWLAGMWRRI
ncbi:MAG: AAA family ATPase [Gammaproteobacteria bacterium]|nr:MAG: AAA family ATPase [Gammaproteobacteria bacterium]